MTRNLGFIRTSHDSRAPTGLKKDLFRIASDRAGILPDRFLDTVLYTVGLLEFRKALENKGLTNGGEGRNRPFIPAFAVQI
jgi:hypothetical protein